MARWVWLWCLCLSWVGFMEQRCSETPLIMTTEWEIRNPSLRWTSVLPAICSNNIRFITHHILHLLLFATIHQNRACRRTDLHQSYSIWLDPVAKLARNNAVRTTQDHRIIGPDLPLAETIDQGYTPINIIRCIGMVTLLHSSNVQVFCRLITILYAICNTVHNQPPVQAKDVQVMGHSGKDRTSTIVVMVGFKCSPLHSFPNNGCHLHVHWKYLQDHQETIQLFDQHRPAQLLHLNIYTAHMGDPASALQCKDSRCLQNRGTEVLQGVQTCIHFWSFPNAKVTQVMMVMIHWTWAVPKANPQSARSKPNSPQSNLPKWWGRPTPVQSTIGEMYGWLGFWWKCSGPLSGGRTIWNSFEMDSCNGKQLL